MRLEKNFMKNLCNFVDLVDCRPVLTVWPGRRMMTGAQGNLLKLTTWLSARAFSDS